MSRLFDFAGGAGMGYSQPNPCFPRIALLCHLRYLESNCLGGQGYQNQRWYDITLGCQEETSVLILVFIRLAHVL